MAQLNYQVNPKELEESFDPLPAAEYIAVIEESEYIPTKSGTGMMLKLKYQIIDGPLKGRRLFENLNLENQNSQAQQIARKALNSIGIATGVEDIKDSSQLHGIPIKIDVRMKDSAEYGKQNVIKKHLPLKEDAQVPAAEGSVDKPAPAPNAGVDNFNKPAGLHPWEKK